MEKLTDKIAFDSGKNGYNIKQNNDFINWLQDCLNNNYEATINLDDIQKAIDMISDWYLKKYNRYSLRNNIYCDNNEFIDLLRNLPPKVLELINCHYRYKNISSRKILVNDELIDTTQINFSISSIESDYNNKYFFYALSDNGRIVSTNFPQVKNGMTIDHLYLILSNTKMSKKYDNSSVEKIIYNHIIDLELRDIIFNLITLRMNILGKGGSSCKNFRFNKMVHDFEYNIDNINLSEDIMSKVDELISITTNISLIKKLTIPFKKKTSNM